MNVELILMLAGVLWLLVGVANSSAPGNTSVMASGPDADVSIFPGPWIPPFTRNDWTIEEVVEGKQVYRARCDESMVGQFKYHDSTLHKNVEIVFADGVVVATVM